MEMKDMDSRNLYQFFQEEVSRTASELKKSVPPDAQIYLANLLSRFTSADQLFIEMEGQRELEPLAFILKRAVEAADESERIRILKHLGDVALYTSGFFPERVERRGIEVDYYIQMGGMAYSNVSSLSGHKAQGRTWRELYERLAHYFKDLVHVLWELAEKSRGVTAESLLDLYRRWERTGSERLARKLAGHGFIITGAAGEC